MFRLASPALHIHRVRLRVSQCGHDIPDADIRRRYERSLRRAPEALRLCDEAVVFDNSGLSAALVAIARRMHRLAGRPRSGVGEMFERVRRAGSCSEAEGLCQLRLLVPVAQ